ncbi:MAG: DUF445 domain-containing protein [Bacteroidota bacterium]
MNGWFFLLPLVAAVLGWVFVSLALRLLFHPVQPKKWLGYSIRGFVPARQQIFAKEAGRLAASFFSIDEIVEKITQPANVKKILPQAEAHIDDFLRLKLVKSMPVVGMFVGDKTINNLKTLFMAELELLFPEIMKTYMNQLREDVDIEKIVTGKIASCPPAIIETALLKLFKKELIIIKWAGALFGFMIGFVQYILLLFLLC